MGLGSDKGMVLPSLKEAVGCLFLKQPPSPSNDNCPGSSDDLGQLSSNFQLPFLGKVIEKLIVQQLQRTLQKQFIWTSSSLSYGIENTLFTL